MRNRIKLKKINKKYNIISLILIIFTLVLMVSILLINHMNKIISPVLVTYGKLRVEQLSNQIVSNAVSNELLEELDINNIFITVQNNDGQIISVDFNPIMVNQFLNNVSQKIRHDLKALEQGQLQLIDGYQDLFYGYDIDKLKQGIIYEIPLGIVTNIALLSNIGPRIPVKFSLVGSLNTHIDTKIENYGINNIIMEIFINIDLSNQLVAPLMAERITYQLNIPLITRILPGEIPKYYHSGISESSPILSVPME